MLRNFNTNLKTIDGMQDLMHEADGKILAASFIDLSIISLTNDLEGEKLAGDIKYKRYKLAQRLEQSRVLKDSIDISLEEVELIKSAVSLRFTSIVVGQFYDFLEAK
jgi:hypothetical protein